MTTWYVNRAAGLVALILLTASILLGLLLSSRLLRSRVRGNWLQDLHRGVAGLACAFVGVHVVAALADPWLDFGLAEVTVPFASSWRPGAITWGIVSMYLLVAVQVTSLLRRRLSPSTWRWFHLLSYPLWLTAAFHGLTAGTTLGTRAGGVALALAGAAIAGLTAIRVLEPHGRTPGDRAPIDGASGAPPMAPPPAPMAWSSTAPAAPPAPTMDLPRPYPTEAPPRWTEPGPF